MIGNDWKRLETIGIHRISSNILMFEPGRDLARFNIISCHLLAFSFPPGPSGRFLTHFDPLPVDQVALRPCGPVPLGGRTQHPCGAATLRHDQPATGARPSRPPSRSKPVGASTAAPRPGTRDPGPKLYVKERPGRPSPPGPAAKNPAPPHSFSPPPVFVNI